MSTEKSPATAGIAATQVPPFGADPEPWPNPVDLEELLDAIQARIERHCVLAPGASVAMALWIVLTYVYDAFHVLPLLSLLSPEKRCGKSTVLRLLKGMVRRGFIVSNITGPGLFRLIDAFRPTMLIDEADTFLGEKEELHGIINSGHTRDGAFALRLVGDKFEPKMFSTWAPKAIAKIGGLPGTLEDRSVVIPMRRKLPHEVVEPLRLDRAEKELEPLRRMVMRWAQDNIDRLSGLDPVVPAQLNDRAQDNWRPLMAIASLAGSEWAARASAASLDLSEVGSSSDPSLRVQLLEDLRSLFSEWPDHGVPTKEILNHLNSLEERPWPELRNGKGINAHSLAKLLREFRTPSGSPLAPTDIWVGSPDQKRCLKGYLIDGFADALRRYLPEPREGRGPSGHAGNHGDEHREGFIPLADDLSLEMPLPAKNLAVLADCKGETGRAA